jgi:hypothetical protein
MIMGDSPAFTLPARQIPGALDRVIGKGHVIPPLGLATNRLDRTDNGSRGRRK